MSSLQFLERINTSETTERPVRSSVTTLKQIQSSISKGEIFVERKSSGVEGSFLGSTQELVDDATRKAVARNDSFPDPFVLRFQLSK